MALGDYSNSRGAADMGLLPDRLPGYWHPDDPAARTALGKLWGADPPQKPGLSAPQMLEAARNGKLGGLHVPGANPSKTFPSGQDKRREQLQLLHVHEMVLTETAALAVNSFTSECAAEIYAT